MSKRVMVGSLSLGVGLVLFGVGLLVDANGGPHMMEWLVRVWPGLLILMGFEVLWRTFGHNSDWGLDFPSILLLGLLVSSATIGYYAYRMSDAVAF